jgi:hypothetical protein
MDSKVLPADPRLLAYATDASLTGRQIAIYSAYVDLTANMKGKKPSMHAMAEYLRRRNKSLPESFDGGVVSATLRRVQYLAAEVGWRTPTEPGVDEATTRKNLNLVNRKLKNNISVYVVTWAQDMTPADYDFLAALEQYKEHRKAVLLVIAGRYKNPTSYWSRKAEEHEKWDGALSEYLIETRFNLGENLTVMGDIKTQPTAEKPLTGFDGITRDKSGIFGHPKVALKTVATPSNRMAKILTTTGAITVENYIDAKAGKKGEFHHTLGATVVEIQDGKFHLRQILWDKKGKSFIDLDKEYSPKGVKQAPRAKGLVLGDLHRDFLDPQCEESIFGKRGLVPFFNPEQVLYHDLLDGYSGSHHHDGQVFTKLAKHRTRRNNVRDEVVRTLEWANEKAMAFPDTQFKVIDSNHDRHLLTWIQKTDPRYDLENLSFWCEIVSMMEQKTEMTASGAWYPSPFQLMGEKLLTVKNVSFVQSPERVIIADIDCTNHGDKGPNGARGTVEALSKVGDKLISAHGHSPAIMHGHYRVGTNSRMDLEYTGDLSSWFHTDCVIYANGKRSLINKIDGEWRAQRRSK